MGRKKRIGMTREQKRGQVKKMKKARGCAWCGFNEDPFRLHFVYRTEQLSERHDHMNIKNLLSNDKPWEEIIDAIDDSVLFCRTHLTAWRAGKPIPLPRNAT